MKKKVLGMATIPSRIETLEIVLKRIYNQVDIIELSLNGFKKIPFFLNKYEKVICNLTSNKMGDANKFFNIDKYENCYYFSCDDDILYPNNYITTYINYIDRYKSLITSHGSIIPKSNINSYYKDRIMKSHCLKKTKEEIVHIPGSGVSGFDTSIVEIKYSMFKKRNMSDIFLGIECKKQNIKCISIKHDEGWIQGGLNENRKTIYEDAKDNDQEQTKLINSIKW